MRSASNNFAMCSRMLLSLVALTSKMVLCSSKPPTTIDDVGGHLQEVHAFYYLWYGSPEIDGKYLHWNHAVLPHWTASVREEWKHLDNYEHEPPGFLHSPFYPERGTYSSRDPVVLREHFLSMQAHGITVAVVSWTGREGKTSDTQGVVTDEVIPFVLSAAEETGMKIAIHLEPYEGRSPATVRDDLEHLITHYGSSPSILRRQRPSCLQANSRDTAALSACPALPVLYVYDSYHNPASAWGRLLCEKEADTVRGTAWDALMISTLLTKQDEDLVIHGCFDGAYSYFASDGFTYGSTSANFGRIASWAEKNDKIFIPSVGPGYDDTRIRPWNFAAQKKRQNGIYYTNMWEQALMAKTAIVSITSFNEWGEGTQIEPAKVPTTLSTAADQSRLLTHQDYGDDPAMYLKITREMAVRGGVVIGGVDSKPAVVPKESEAGEL